MEKMRKLIMLFVLLMAGGTASAQMTVLFRDTISDGQCLYGLYYSYYDWEGHKISESYYALIRDIVSTSSWVTVPATISKGGKTYYIRGIDEGENLGISTNDHNVKSLTFEGDVTVWKSPIKVPGGMFGFNTLRFNGRSYPFEGDISNYFTSTSFNNVTAYLPDKTTTQIADLRDNHVKPWDQFYNVVYSPIHLNLTNNITLCPQTNYSEDVALYSLGEYESFAAANYDTDRLTPMNYKTPGVYEINKYQNYVLIARYDKQNVDCQYVRQGYNWSFSNNYNTDFDEFFDVTSDITLDLTFTWKTNSMNFIQVNGSKNISYSIAGEKPMSGSNAEPIWALTGAMNGDQLTLTLPANGLTLEKIVFKHGNAEQTIAAPQPANGNYQVQMTIPSDMFSYVYVFWAEPEPNTHTFLRHGGTGHAYLLYEDNGEEYESPIEIGTTTINLPDFNSDDCTYASFYVDKVKGEKFTAYRDGVEVTGDFEINNYGSQFIYNFDSDDNSESHRQSSVWTLIFEQTNDIIEFADAKVKAICVENWDTNEDGELSYEEAAAVTDIGEVFKGNTEITSFDEFQHFTGVTRIGKDAFRGDTELTSIVLPQSVVQIYGGWAFYGCSSLEHVVLPDNIGIVDTATFGQTNISSINFPETANLILGYGVITHAPLKSLFIPANVVTINDYVIYNCPNLACISVDEGNTIFDSREGCNAIIKTSTNTLIASCKNSVIPESVTALGNYAFFKTDGLTKLELPAGLTSIGKSGIRDCSSLTTIVAHMPEPFAINTSGSSNDYNISDLPANCKLVVPAGKRQAYIDAGWTEAIFRGGVVEAEGSGILGDVNGDGQVTIADVTALVNIILKK